MANTANIRDLWQNKTYSDLIIASGGCFFHVHQCIVLPRSKTLRDAMKQVRLSEYGRTLVIGPDWSPEDVEVILKFMYDNREPRIFRDSTPGSIVAIFEWAVRDGMADLEAKAWRALLPTSQDPIASAEVPILLQQMRGIMCDGVVEKSMDLEVAWMPQLLLSSATRARVSDEAVKRYLDSTVARKTSINAAENASEKNEDVGDNPEESSDGSSLEPAAKRQRKETKEDRLEMGLQELLHGKRFSLEGMLRPRSTGPGTPSPL
ncbi:unnamed protein product [Zymoseptoria tritici ST99CH_1A5]|uniref:BTB domain-containing protein n=1 Tax=Zymoseptoria tritici ST99CH_1A5 TaxID=1276529 RepID=A0A1Y6LVW6_ZYMTR|nr:unnamed protein product [Zymoseptoria tritici ST99CH_1A5]